MTSPNFLISQWPETELVAEDLDAAVLQPQSWHHFASSCLQQTRTDQPREGTTVWVSAVSPVRAAIAWGWTEMAEGVLVLQNPNALVANFQVSVSPQGMEKLEADRRLLLLLNIIVNGLNWQAKVLAELRGEPSVAAPQVLGTAL